jgi:DNA polymerase III sliding clamp (beta) subunit (PCNA family)
MQITAGRLRGKAGAATTVSARKLHDLLRALPDDATLNIDVSGSRMTVRAGRSRFNLQTLAAGDYPRISLGQDKLQSLSLPQKDLRALFRLVEFAMAQQDIRYYLNGMLLVIDRGSLQAVATDGHRLSWASLAVDGEFTRQEVILPRKTVLELGKLLVDSDDPVSIDILANQVRFRFANVELVSKVVDGKFPDYNRVIPRRTQVVELPRPSCWRRCSARRSSPTRSSAACAWCWAPGSSRSSAATASRKRPRKSSKSITGATRSTSASTSPTCSTCCRTSRWSASSSRSATPIPAP